MKKNILTCVIFIIAGFSYLSYGQWVPANGPQGGNANAVARIGGAIYAGMPNGIYISNDEGLTWQLSPLIGTNTCNGIYSGGDTAIILYSNYGYNNENIYSITTFNGGASWSSPVATGYVLSDGYSGNITPVRIQNAIAVFSSNTISTSPDSIYYVTYNFGATWGGFSPTWINIDSFENNFYYDTGTIIALSENVYTGNTNLYYSTNGMQSWQSANTMQFNTEVGLVDDTVWIAGLWSADTNYSVYFARTVNKGLSFDTVFSLPEADNVESITMLNGVYYANAYNQNSQTPVTFASYDKGITWSGPVAAPANNNYGVLLNNGNYIQIRYTTAGASLVTFATAQDTFYLTNTGMLSRPVVSLFSNNNVLFAGCNDDVYRSADAGQTWTATGLNLNNVYDMLFVGDTVFAATSYYVARSLNNGATWDTMANGTNDGYQDWGSLANLNGRIIFSGDQYRYTDDYGATWNTMPYFAPNGNGDNIGPIAVSGNNLLSVGMEGTICMYNNNTQTWDSVFGTSSPGAHTWNVIYNVDSALVISAEEQLLISTDHGLTWNVSPLNGMPLPFPGIFAEVPKNIISQNGLWIGTVDNGLLLEQTGFDSLWSSSDMGQTWQVMQNSPLPFLSSYLVHDLAFMNNILYSTSAFSSVWQYASSFNNLSGNVYNDLNNNGVRDPGEPGLSQTLVNMIPANLVTTTDTGGNYAMVSYVVGDTLRPSPPVFFGVVSPPYYLTPTNTAANLNFGIYIPPHVADLSIDITNAEPFYWVDNDYLTVSVLNKGSLPQAATVQLVLSAGLFYLGATPAPQSNLNDTLTWVTDTLQILQQATFTVWVEPYANIGAPVICNALVLPVVNDTLPADNYATLTDSVVGPFDPNSKICVQGSYISNQQIAQGQALSYIVRFQNDGNAQAVNVHIADTLSTYFDMSTFQVISSSYPVQFNLHNSGIVDFYFTNINLPPSSAGEDSSSGFVKYSVNCKTSLSTGNAITNTASIYFDNNPAVVTNTDITLVGFNEALPGFNTGIAPVSPQWANIKVYPNPTGNMLHVDLGAVEGGNMLIEMYDATGRMVKNQPVENSLETLYLNNLEDGMYFGRVLLNGKLYAAFRVIVSR